MLEDAALVVADVFDGDEVDGLGAFVEEAGHDVLDGAIIGDDEAVFTEEDGADPAEDESDGDEGEDDDGEINAGGDVVGGGDEVVGDVGGEENYPSSEEEDDGDDFADPDIKKSDFVADYADFDVFVVSELEVGVVGAGAFAAEFNEGLAVFSGLLAGGFGGNGDGRMIIERTAVNVVRIW